MTHIYIVLLCGSAITKLAEKRQNNCGKEKKKWKHPAYLRKERTQLLKRENMWNDVLICGKGTKQLRKRKKNVETSFLFMEKGQNNCGKEKKMWKRRSYLWKRDKTIAEKRKKNVETSFLFVEKGQNNCGKEKKMWKRRSYLWKRDKTIAEKRKKMWKRRSYLWKRDKTIAEKRKKCRNVVLICGKGTKQLRKREKNVETSFSIFFLLFPHFTTDCEKIVLLTSEFNCSRHLIGQFLFCRDYFLSNCD